jgi:hypothetical protein
MDGNQTTVAAILNEWQHLSSKGSFLQSPPISYKKIGPIDSGVREIMDGNEIQDGCHGGHVE